MGDHTCRECVSYANPDKGTAICAMKAKFVQGSARVCHEGRMRKGTTTETREATAVSEWKCDQCGKTFASKGSLGQHRRFCKADAPSAKPTGGGRCEARAA